MKTGFSALAVEDGIMKTVDLMILTLVIIVCRINCG